MGMAAGQARLLSITSRMSDNELRAQIINNEKMRLATKSSQVSEAYTTALNDAQMMFTNYDADNNATYQQLTFNALTAYNPYNNQYAISNASGQVLVSETDATNYKAANGDLNKFLGYYGLEYSTTYFDNLNKYANSDETIPFSTGEKDNDGNMILANTGYTAEMLKAAYEGTDGHLGYNAVKASTDYYNYTSALTNFNEAYTAYTATISTQMENVLNGTIQGNGKTLDVIKNDLDSAANAKDINAMKNVFTNLSAFVTEAAKLSLPDDTSKKYFENLQNDIELACNGKTEYTEADNFIQFTGDKDNGTISIGTGEDPDYQITKTTSSGSSSYTILAYDEASDSMKPLSASEYSLNWASDGTISLTIGSGDSQTKYTGIPNYFNNTSISEYKVTEEIPLDIDRMKKAGNDIITSLKSSIYNVWNPGASIFTDPNSNEYKNYITAGKALEECIFGTIGSLTAEEYPNLLDVSWNLDRMNETQLNKFMPILDVIMLDNVMNTYGEIKYAWIDKSEVTDSYNENGDAKAQWYTNLFNRMQSGGYQVLQDGLASSTEWIEFAFESGLVTLEQVDSKYNWNTLMYSSCSDITEQTDSTAITIAEAEYNAAMNKIENKDKMYDLELKNIDTEHNSLQTEYDSIKTAIDKNIERTFKLYS
ncbi:unknown [Clostridium sp. CAG:768]|nr:unknown [Clostridium sp. CAG:768]